MTTVSDLLQQRIIEKQSYSCANNLTEKITGLEDYKCPLWKKTGKEKGVFDACGYDFIHVTNSLTKKKKFTALCKLCHVVLTRRMAKTYAKKITNPYIKEINYCNDFIQIVCNGEKGITKEDVKIFVNDIVEEDDLNSAKEEEEFKKISKQLEHNFLIYSQLMSYLELERNEISNKLVQINLKANFKQNKKEDINIENII